MFVLGHHYKSIGGTTFGRRDFLRSHGYIRLTNGQTFFLHRVSNAQVLSYIYHVTEIQLLTVKCLSH